MFQPEIVSRDKYGYWLHSVVAESLEDVPIPCLPQAADMEFSFVSFDTDAPELFQKRYFEEGNPGVTEWTPTTPEGDGWFLLGIYDTEDGPYACFTRPISIKI